MPKPSKQPSAELLSIAAVAQRARWREADARVVVAAWKASGLSIRDFATHHGLPHKRLERWAYTLRKKDTPKTEAPLRFVPVEVSAPTETRPSAKGKPNADSMELALPTGIRVTVGAGFDPLALKRLLETVGC